MKVWKCGSVESGEIGAGGGLYGETVKFQARLYLGSRPSAARVQCLHVAGANANTRGQALAAAISTMSASKTLLILTGKNPSNTH